MKPTIIRAEQQYLDNLRYIYEHGTDLYNARTGKSVRTVINVDQTYDASSNAAPILTTRKMANQGLSIAELLGYIRGVRSAVDMRALGTKSWDCVPTSTKILTKRGILNYDEVRVGDETIGFDPSTGFSEWTVIRNIVHYKDADVVRVGNSTYGYHCTPNHKWLTIPDNRSKSKEYLDLFELRETTNLPRGNIVLSAPHRPLFGLNITDNEASLLGWIAGDGHVEKFNDSPRGRKRPSMSVMQTKEKHFHAIIDSLPVDQYSTYIKNRGDKKDYTWRLTPEYSDDLKSRAGDPKKDAFFQVMNMSYTQRLSWLEAVYDAEGSHNTVYQCDGQVAEAIKLAIYLEGLRPSGTYLSGKEQWAPCMGITSCDPYLSRNGRTVTGAGVSDVWCVETSLGTWTAYENGFLFLTGNSNANENKAWLANPVRTGEDDLGMIYGTVAKNWPVMHHLHTPEYPIVDSKGMDLFHKVYNNLKQGIDDRGEIITFWNPGMFHLGCLRPCMYEHQFSLLGDDLYLNSTQRSNDFPLGNPANMVQVWLLLRLMAQITGKNPKVAYHRSVNAHIYDNQLELVPEQLARTPLAQPTIDINPDIKTLEDLETWVSIADFKITYPEHHGAIKYPFAV